MIRLALSVLLLVAALLGLGGVARAQPQLPNGNAIAVKLEAELARVAPGATVTLAIVMQPDDGWHGYWANPGDAGLPAEAKWDLPSGVTAGSLQYPTPTRLTVQNIMNYVYKGDYAILVDFAISPEVKAGTTLPIRLALNWLACTDEICVPEEGGAKIDLQVGASGGPTNGSFAAYRRALPVPLDKAGTWSREKDGAFRLAIPYPADAPLDDPYFFAGTDGALDYGAEQRFYRAGDRLVMETASRAGDIGEVTGVLQIAPGEGLAIRAEPGEVARVGLVPVGDGPIAQDGSFLPILGAAILGGLLLNILPCVFPILGLKAVSLARSTAGEASARRDAHYYTAGGVLACLALGAMLLVLRAGGEQLGWAFQLQDPRIVALLFLLLVAIAANLAGLFELPALFAGRAGGEVTGRAGSFGTGALAAFIATPCTGPFMAAALGAALFLPPVQALALFAGLGFGLALPFLLLAYIPALRRALPRPGPWMERFRRWMALPMALTALAAAWLLWRLAGPWALAIMVAVALMLLAFLRLVGRRQRRGMALPRMSVLATGLAALVAAAFVPTTVDSAGAERVVARKLDDEPFSVGRLTELRRSGQPIFVYFTADWCLTCKANEAAAIERDSVAAAFKRKDIAVLRGDYTRRSPEIARFLAYHKRPGVPLYLFYPAKGKPRILPQILTAGMLTELE